MTHENRTWKILFARKMVPSEPGKEVNLNQCLIACEYIKTKSLQHVLNSMWRVDVYKEAARIELFERALLGKKRKLL